MDAWHRQREANKAYAIQWAPRFFATMRGAVSGRVRSAMPSMLAAWMNDKGLRRLPSLSEAAVFVSSGRADQAASGWGVKASREFLGATSGASPCRAETIAAIAEIVNR
jgi:hypothetical protein